MKKICMLIALTGGLASYQCFALTVDVTRDGINYGHSPGGEFTVTLDPSDAGDPLFQDILNHYVSQTIVNGGFETFCISETTGIGPNPQNATLTPNGVTVGTAFLYYQFGKGTLAGYDYTPGAGRVATAWDLQNSIWELQGSAFDPVAAAVFLTSIQFTTVFSSLANAEVANNGTYAVDKLNLSYTDVDGVHVSQPMLALVPDGGMTVMLLGLAFGGFCFVSRKTCKIRV